MKLLRVQVRGSFEESFEEFQAISRSSEEFQGVSVFGLKSSRVQVRGSFEESFEEFQGVPRSFEEFKEFLFLDFLNNFKLQGA